MRDFFKIHENDNVVVALRDLKQDELITVDDTSVHVKEEVSSGHKLAIMDIPSGGDILKYGYPIGRALRPITAGELVHTHNLRTSLAESQDYQYSPIPTQNPYKLENLTFKGFKRKNGSVGIRNELWIIPTVGCVNGTAETIVKRFEKYAGDGHPFDNVMVLKHSFGCSQLGEDHENTKRILLDAVRHPNAGGVLVLGLGCENNELSVFKEALEALEAPGALGKIDQDRVKFLNAQSVDDEVEEGLKLLLELRESAKNDNRVDVPLSELKIGLKCGGSDGFSGITANPLLGRFSDYLIAQGGTTVLTEVPEMFGAESILMRQAESLEVFDKISAMINDFKAYFVSYHQPVYENPSPGNKAGGISTLEEKSLGCTQKAGTAMVVDVLKYGEVLLKKGLNLLCAPGNDLVASTALAAAGCQMVLFTTGRGTPFGTFVPTLKISTNTQIYEKKPHWIDFNAGALLEDRISPEKIMKELIDCIIRVASGEQVNNERNDFREISLFKNGVTL